MEKRRRRRNKRDKRRAQRTIIALRAPPKVLSAPRWKSSFSSRRFAPAAISERRPLFARLDQPRSPIQFARAMLETQSSPSSRRHFPPLCQKKKQFSWGYIKRKGKKQEQEKELFLLDCIYLYYVVYTTDIFLSSLKLKKKEKDGRAEKKVKRGLGTLFGPSLAVSLSGEREREPKLPIGCDDGTNLLASPFLTRKIPSGPAVTRAGRNEQESRGGEIIRKDELPKRRKVEAHFLSLSCCAVDIPPSASKMASPSCAHGPTQMREGHARRRERESNRGRSRWNEGTCGRLDTFGFKGAWRDVRDITKKQKCCQTRKEKGMRKGGENVGNHHLLWRRSSERPWRWLAPHVSCFARRVMLARHYRWWYTRNENVFLPNSERGSRLLFIWVRRKKNRFK